MTFDRIKKKIKQWKGYHYVHVLRHAGLAHLIRRERIVREIDRIAPRRTRPWEPNSAGGAVEVHMLVRDQDVRMALWCLHSFFKAADVDWAIVLHQGGRMNPRDWAMIHAKFPDAYALKTPEADRLVEAQLQQRAMPNTLAVRRYSPMLRKLVDPVLLSSAVSLFVPDSDVLFFRRPEWLLAAAGQADRRNAYNRDHITYGYNIPSEESVKRFGVSPAESINAGLSLLNRQSIRLDRIEQYTGDPVIISAPFFVEQTIHGLLAGEFGHDFFPDTYACTKQPGLTTASGEPLVAKHYIETPRPLFFDEGIPAVLKATTAEVSGV